MKESLHDEWKDFRLAHLEPPPISIRFNPEKKFTTASLEEVPWSRYGRYLPARPVFTLDPAFHAGVYYVQEASSMFLEQAFNQHVSSKDGLRILDLCAAPGGKSTHILSLIGKNNLLISNEVIRSRVNVLTENVQKWGSPNVAITNNDAKDFSSLESFFDVIVVDAPCSGEGLFRKDPTAMQEWSDQNVLLCANRQKRILEDIWPALKKDGLLIYSTCTYNEMENEQNLLWLSQQKDVEFLSIQTEDHWGIEAMEQKNIRGYRFYPHKVKGEGFFISVIRKNESAMETRIPRDKKVFAPPPVRILEQVKSWVQPEDYTIIQRNELIQLLPSQFINEINYIAKNLRLLYSGTFIATQKHEKLIPEQSFALSSTINRSNFHHVALNETEALQYLRKENLSVQPGHKGFALATYQDTPLGWMNVLQGRINNLYPSEWRIRMK